MPPDDWKDWAALIRPEIELLVKSRQQRDDLLVPDPVPYDHRPNLQILFPGFLDWLPYSANEDVPGWVYEIRRRHASFQVSLKRTIGEYPAVKQHYEGAILRLLDHHIRHSATGRAILHEIGLASNYTGSIIPYHPKDDDDYDASVSPASQKNATAVGMPVNDDQGRLSQGANGKPLGSGTGRGSDVTIRYTPGMWPSGPFGPGRNTATNHPPTGPGSRPDEVLLHELVHAGRDMRGLRYRLGVSAGMDNEEEFLAVIIANIYLSEKGQTNLRANHLGHNTMQDPDNFIDETHFNLQPRVLLERLRLGQLSLFESLARIDVPFNPVRAYSEELKAAAKQPAKAGTAH